MGQLECQDVLIGKFLLFFCDSKSSEGLLAVMLLSNKYKWNFLMLDIFLLIEDGLFLLIDR